MPPRNDLKYGNISVGNSQIHTYFPPLIGRWAGAAFNLISLINDIETNGQWNEVDELIERARDKLDLKLMPKVNTEWLEEGEVEALIKPTDDFTVNVPTMHFIPLHPEGDVIGPPRPEPYMQGCECSGCIAYTTWIRDGQHAR